MPTELPIPDDLWPVLRARAAAEGITVDELIESALKARLRTPPTPKAGKRRSPQPSERRDKSSG